MIYLDNAATSYPKPLQVKKAVSSSFSYSANPGRAGHRLSIKASEEIYNCRNKIANMFGVDSPEKVIFTSGCTVALNTVIKGTLQKGDHVIVSSLEHNSVLRPLQKLSDSGLIEYSVCTVFPEDDNKTLDSFRQNIKKNTKLAICSHASNVFGVLSPVSKLAALCRYYNILFCIDASQTAGLFDINLGEIGADFLCAPGHKGLYGPMGIGFMIVNNTIPDSLYEGGTGSSSENFSQPSVIPDRFESGTLNLHGIVGLSAGLDFINSYGVNQIREKEIRLLSYLFSKLRNTHGITLYQDNVKSGAPILSFNIDGMNSEDVALILDRKFGIAVRAGMHCSPAAHKHYGTLDTGTVRVSPSVFSTYNDINYLIKAVSYINKNKNTLIKLENTDL